jgi:hypothetical protein
MKHISNFFSTSLLISIGLVNVTAQDAPAEVVQSEVGVQQPVESSQGLSGAAGYEVQYLYRDNPFYLDDAPTQTARSRVMIHTFYGAVTIPESTRINLTSKNTVGVMKQLVRYQESMLENFDYETLSVFYKGELASVGDWKPSIGVAYAEVEITEANLDAFDGSFPFISASKNYGKYVATIKTSYSFTEVKGGTSSDKDRLNAWTTGVTLSQHNRLNNRMGFNSNASLSYAYFNEGTNSGRDDITFEAGTSLYYNISKYLKGDLFVDYIKRGSNMNYDYTNWDAGLKINAALAF